MHYTMLVHITNNALTQCSRMLQCLTSSHEEWPIPWYDLNPALLLKDLMSVDVICPKLNATSGSLSPWHWSTGVSLFDTAAWWIHTILLAFNSNTRQSILSAVFKQFTPYVIKVNTFQLLFKTHYIYDLVTYLNKIPASHWFKRSLLIPQSTSVWYWSYDRSNGGCYCEQVEVNFSLKWHRPQYVTSKVTALKQCGICERYQINKNISFWL